MKFFLLLIFILLLSVSGLYAQSESPLLHFGGEKLRDELLDAVRARDGGLLATGSAESPSSDKRDVTLLKIDRSGNRVFSKSLGSRLLDDYGLAVVEDSNGKIWVGGYSDSAAYQIAWLLCCDATGEVIWEKRLAARSESAAVQDLEISPDGRTVACAGVVEGHPWLRLFDLEGNPMGGESIYVRTEAGDELTLKKVSLAAARGSWYLYGGVLRANDKKISPVFLKIDETGDLKATALLTGFPVEKTGQCLVTPAGNLLATGMVTVPLLSEEAFVISIDRNLSKQKISFVTFGGDGFDEGEGIAMLGTNTYMVAGSTTSHKHGVKVTNMAAWKIRIDGQRLEAGMTAPGESLEERASRAVCTLSGDVWLCGTQNAGTAFRNDPDFAWVKIGTVAPPPSDILSGW